MRSRVFSAFVVAPLFVIACSGSDDGGSSSNPVVPGADASGGLDSTADGIGPISNGDAFVTPDSPPGIDAAADSSSSDSAAPSDAGIPDVAVYDGGSCNALVNAGPQVTMVNVPQDPPAGQGGTIALGLYYLTKWETYTGPGGASGATQSVRQSAFLFSSSTQYLKVTKDINLGQPDENDNRTYSTQGTTLVSNQSCPTVDTLSSDYTATPTTLVLIAGGEVHTFTRQ